MSEEDKPQTSQSKNIPEDGQVIMSIMKEMGVTDYDPKTIDQLTEFVYRSSTAILKEAQMYANKSNKESLDVDDIRLALQLTKETTPPPREVLLECANVINSTPLPLVKPHCGLRLPPDRYCLSSCNYALKSSKQKEPKPNYSGYGEESPMKVSKKLHVSYANRTPMEVTKQSITVPKPVAKVAANVPVQQKMILKPKIKLQSQNIHIASTSGAAMEVESSLKRKKEDDGDM